MGLGGSNPSTAIGGIMVIGFTGTRKGMTNDQKEKIKRILSDHDRFPKIVYVRHGDCIGADCEFHEIAVSMNIPVIIHPPIDDKNRANCNKFIECWPKKQYLDRDRDIVNNSDVLMAAPNTNKEKLRSGTWYTVRYARKMGKPIIMIYP
jgi:hypothetical protein